MVLVCVGFCVSLLTGALRPFEAAVIGDISESFIVYNQYFVAQQQQTNSVNLTVLK
jgi:hypothetical protein